MREKSTAHGRPPTNHTLKAFDQEIVSGSIFRSVWKLAWPVVLLNLINGLHGLVDHVLIGQFVPSPDNAANAAVGVAWQTFLVLVVLIASLFHGMNVLIARYAGMQDRKQMSVVAYQAFLTTTLVFFFVAPLGYVIAPYLLRLINAGPEVNRQALPYLRILFTCAGPLFLMFMLTGAFHASGAPRTPLALGILTTTLNILLSAVLIIGPGPIPSLGVVGAALGTVLAPIPSVAIALSLIMRRKMVLQPPERFTLIPDLQVLRTIARVGIPTGIQGVVLNIGGFAILMYAGMTQHGAAAQAAFTICYAQLFSVVTWPSFGLRAAAGTVMGQNIGAGKPARGKRGVALAAYMGAVWAMGAGLVYWFFPETLLGFFNATEGPVFTYGIEFLRFLAVSGFFLATGLALTGGIQGAGQTTIPMLIAIFTQIIVLLGICQVFYLTGTLTPARIWMAILVSHVLRLLLTLLVFRTERWTHTVVRIHDA